MKKISLIILIILICGGVYLIYLHAPHSATTNSNGSSTPITGITSNTNSMPIDFTGMDGTIDHLSSLKNATTGVVVSFKYIPADGSDSSADVYANGKKVGTISGGGITMISFSPSGTYLGLRSAAVFGANNYGFAIDVINLNNGVALHLKPQIQSAPYPSNQYNSTSLEKYIDFYVWDGNNAIDITSEYILPLQAQTSTTVKYYRASPMETWQYNLVTGSSTLISSTP